MGARLVSLVLVRWTHVSDRAFRVLVRMALTALDEATPNNPALLYFAGQDLLALTLRNERGGRHESVLRNARHALDELIDEGAIKRTRNARSGQNAVYLLTLDGARKIDQHPLTSPPQAEPDVPPEAESHVPAEAEPDVPGWRNPTFPPRNQEEPVEDLEGEEQSADLRTAVTVARTREAAADPEDFSDKPFLRLVAALDVPTEERSDTENGNGFCIPCYRAGQFSLAADPESGSACAMHLRQEAS